MRLTTEGLVLAPVLLRGLAFFIDLAIINVLSIPVAAVMGFDGEHRDQHHEQD